MKVVIIGCGGAGISCAKALLRSELVTELVLVHNEKIDPYYRPFISKCFIQDREKVDGFYLNDKEWYKNQKISLIENDVKEINIDKKLIITKNSEEISYDKLLISTGSHAFKLPNLDYSIPGVYHLINDEDVSKIGDFFKQYKPKKALIIGGGILGCEAAYSLKNLNVSVEIVELMPQLFPRLLTKKASNYLNKFILEKDIKITVNHSINKISKNSNGQITAEFLTANEAKRIFSAKMKNESVGNIEVIRKGVYDIIIVAVGVRPNIEFINKEKIKINKGIVVDTTLKTSVDDVYAAGDIIEIPPHMTKMLWFPALEQGRIVANNILGKEAHYNPEKAYPVLYSSFDMVLTSVGSPLDIKDDMQKCEKIKSEKEASFLVFNKNKDKIYWGASFNDNKTSQIISMAGFKPHSELIQQFIDYEPKTNK